MAANAGFGSGRKQLALKIESDVVLNQDCSGRRAVARILGHPREFELDDTGPPFTDGLLQSSPEGGGIELFDGIRTRGIAGKRRAVPAHENDFRAEREEFRRGRSKIVHEAEE